MNLRSCFVRLTAGLMALSVYSVGWAQAGAEIALGTDGAPPGGQVVIPIDWQGDGEVSSFTAWIDFDENVITPVVTGANNSVVGCLAGLPPTHTGILTACRNPAPTPGRIVLVVSDQSGESTTLGDTPVGTITFDINPAATVPSTEPVVVVIQEASNVSFEILPPGTVTEVNGEVNVLDQSAILNVTPAELPFGSRQVNTASPAQQFTISNDGTDGIDMEVSALGLPDGPFTRSGGSCSATLPFTLVDGASCTVGVVFTPTDTIAYDATITVVSDAGAVTNDEVRLTGTGTPGPQSTLSVDGPLDFGSLDLNDLPETGTITATNTGDAGSSLTISDVTYAGDAAFEITSNGCAGAAGVLAQNQSCSVVVTFDTAATGSSNGTVSFTSNADSNPTPTVSVLGTATAEADISVIPGFGQVNLGTGAAGETLTANGTITNSGSASADVSCVLNDSTGVFSTTPSPLTATVDANSTVNFSLACALPGDGTEGDTYAATLVCSVDGDEVGTHDLSCGVSTFVVPIPTMQNWALILFALIMLLVGGLSIRFFRV